jgi:hypothetical protein
MNHAQVPDFLIFPPLLLDHNQDKPICEAVNGIESYLIEKTLRISMQGIGCQGLDIP